MPPEYQEATERETVDGLSEQVIKPFRIGEVATSPFDETVTTRIGAICPSGQIGEDRLRNRVAARVGVGAKMLGETSADETRCAGDDHPHYRQAFTTFWSMAPNKGVPSGSRASMRTRSPKRMKPVFDSPRSIISIARRSAMQEEPTSR